MSAVESTMVALGSKAPSFKLPIVTGGFVDLYSYTRYSKGTLVAFVCNHCPYVKHINQQFVEIAHNCIRQGIAVVAISSNDTENYPQDAPDKMIQVAKEEGFPFPYLFDESQSVAKSYQAACTPDFFLFDDTHELVYRGQFDSSRPGNDIPVTGRDVQAAIDRLQGSEAPVEQQIPSIGCNIKWKPGNEPEYYGIK